jgi:hypothetical protein
MVKFSFFDNIQQNNHDIRKELQEAEPPLMAFLGWALETRSKNDCWVLQNDSILKIPIGYYSTIFNSSIFQKAPPSAEY